jgi:hypothetical protein
MDQGRGQRAEGRSVECAAAGHLFSKEKMTNARPFLTLVFCLLPSALILSLPRQQTRDAAGTIVVGTASIAGVIVAADPAAPPIRRATITLNGGGGRAGGLGRGGRVTVSDDAGAFQFAALPEGRYTITAAKAGWVTTQYGATRPGRGGGVTINLADGQQLSSVRMKMTHGAAITGTLFADGRLLPQSVQMRALPVQTIDGDRRLSGQTGNATYDERGVYRIYGLPPGDYLIGAAFPSMGIDLRVATEEELLWAQQLLKRPPASSPIATASTTNAAASPDDTAPPAPGGRVGYAPVYYPGTLDPAQAEIVTIHAAEERRNVDFPLRLLPTAAIKGTVFDPQGVTLQNAQVMITRTSRVTGADSSDQAQMRNGVYVFPEVSPGEYTIIVRAMARGSMVGGPGAPPPPPPPPGPPGSPSPQGPQAPTVLWASVDVHVDGRDISDQDLRLQPGMTISGRIVFEDGTPPAAAEHASLGLNVLPSGGNNPFGTPGATVNPDGTFVIAGVTPGRYAIHAGAAGAGSGPGVLNWNLKSVVIAGRDVTDSGFEVPPNQNLSAVTVSLTALSTEISGTLVDATGRPSADDYIVIFTANRTLWRPDSRWATRARPDSDGHWRIASLPPGNYYVCALTDLDPSDLSDPAFLAEIAPASFTIALAPGEKKTLDLKVGKGPS